MTCKSDIPPGRYLGFLTYPLSGGALGRFLVICHDKNTKASSFGVNIFPSYIIIFIDISSNEITGPNNMYTVL